MVGRKLDEGLDRLVVLLVEVLTALAGAELREGVDHHESGIRVSVEPGFQGIKASISEPGPLGGELEAFRSSAAWQELLQPGLEPSGIVLKGQVEDRTLSTLFVPRATPPAATAKDVPRASQLLPIFGLPARIVVPLGRSQAQSNAASGTRWP